MKAIQTLCAATILGLIANPAAAQSSDNTGQTLPGDVRVQAGIVIPLGSGGSQAERAPRVELWSDRSAQRPLPQVKLGPDYDPQQARPVRLGLNLSGSTRLMINGREMPQPEGSKKISGLGIAGIVVGVVVLAAAVFVIEYKTSGLGD